MPEAVLIPPRSGADSIVDRSDALLRLSEALSATTTPADVIATVEALLVDCLGTGPSSVRVALEQHDPLTSRTVEDCRALYFGDPTEIIAAFPALAADLDFAAAACLPLRGTGRTLGALLLTWSHARMFYIGERAFFSTVAAYTAQALARSVHLQSRITAVETLQGAMLSPLPAVDGYRLAGHYLPAEGGKVGGDWYDAVSTSAGRLTLAIGDVAGHDMAAAARMGSLRSMLRAYLVDRREPPASLLRRLDTANHALGDPTVATAIVAAIHRTPDGTHRLHWSNAGHPPPVLIEPGRSVRALLGNDILLGAYPGTPRRTYTCALPTGSIVLLHTDGLVEDRGRHIDAGLARLYRRLRRSGATRLDDLLIDAVGGLGGKADDDVALLAVKVG
ncbi:PP2C family protein-serine/threonine phosphatase [Actinoplanes friuliensis]|uniref:Putative magnesium/manganese-dependent protein phosphatase n=1 Tax=Actinoplanes friuliensis DSM 7358 TaxID=1246995 RepID=U5VV61_9ACTN|nr:GAF domain-containing SpoIIE family protein phosphatase [Actinoplanes friuliensis]AGZ40759.1 putative magnesium/manganese-dependent protein phosphatase [Actinoplanes friuliensis DSM 7358]